MKLRNFCYPTTLFAVLLYASSALALPDDRNQPIKVRADSLDSSSSKHLSVYSGKVVITQGSLQVRADKVEVHANAQGKINKVIAVGKPAHFQQQIQESVNPIKAKAQRIEFMVSSDSLQLTGEAHVDRDGNTLSAERIDYDLASEQIKASKSGKAQVEMIWQASEKPIQPTDTTQQDNL